MFSNDLVSQLFSDACLLELVCMAMHRKMV